MRFSNIPLNVVVFIATNTLIANAVVPTGSMENTIMTGSRIIINRLAYLTENPERGDVISFWFPDNEEESYLKKDNCPSGRNDRRKRWKNLY